MINVRYTRPKECGQDEHTECSHYSYQNCLQYSAMERATNQQLRKAINI